MLLTIFGLFFLNQILLACKQFFIKKDLSVRISALSSDISRKNAQPDFKIIASFEIIDDHATSHFDSLCKKKA
jgi:hypothetical protein